MKNVILESPYSGDINRNVDYARRALRDCILRGEAPFASHLLYTQEGVLRDDVAEEREKGISAGLNWLIFAEQVCYYTDHGWSPGMLRSFKLVWQIKKDFRIRSFGTPQYPFVLEDVVHAILVEKTEPPL